MNMIQSLFLTVQGTFFQYIGEILKITIPIYLIILAYKTYKNGISFIKLSRCLLEFIFCGYIITVLMLTDILTIKLSDFNTFHITPNLIPLKSTINDFIQHPSIVLEQILLNVVFFIPFGFLCSMIFLNQKKSFIKITVFSLIFTFYIEILEYLVGRYFDIDDILWNVIGAILGIILYKLYMKLSKVFIGLDSIKKET